MKKMILFLIGIIPFMLGFLMNSWLIQNPNSILPFKLIGIIFLVFWILVGFITCKFEKTSYLSAVTIHLPAVLVLLLIMYQDMILGQFWPNMIGLATQFYYLPLTNISSFIFGGGLYVQMWTASVMAFLLMYGSYYLGCYLKKILSSK